MERRPEGTVAVDSLLEGPGHPFEIDGGLGIHSDEVALVGIPMSGTEALHRLVNDGDVPPPRVVVLKLNRMSKGT